MEARQLSAPDSEPFRLALRMRHPSIDPADITRALAIEPEHAFRAGTPRPSRTGAPVHAQSYWLGILNAVEPRPELSFIRNNLGWALSLSCARILKAHAELLRRIRAEGGDIALLVTIYDGEIDGFSLAPEASQIFGDLGVTVEFEIAKE